MAPGGLKSVGGEDVERCSNGLLFVGEDGRVSALVAANGFEAARLLKPLAGQPPPFQREANTGCVLPQLNGDCLDNPGSLRGG